MHYETLKHSGDYPIIGVNTFLSSKGSPTTIPGEVIRATNDEKEKQIKALESLHKANVECSAAQLSGLQKAAVSGDNLFEKLMEAVKYCSLGQITHAMFEVGGQYRRNM